MFSFSRSRSRGSRNDLDQLNSPDITNNDQVLSPVESLPESPSESKKRGKVNSLLRLGLEKGLEFSKEEAVKGRMYIEKSLGLGAQPNAIPPDIATINWPSRAVYLGWHPVAGFGGKWFAEQTRIGQKITKEIGKYPDPTQHWAVLVGSFCHQLWMDEKLDIIYINGVINPDEWHTFEVGTTTFNDEALRQTGEMTIHNMRQQRPAYNLISNNCQNFAVNLLDAIQTGAHQEFATTFAIYQRATGKGSIKDLFSDSSPQETLPAQAEAHATHDATMQYAHQVIDQNTTKLDNHHHHC